MIKRIMLLAFLVALTIPVLAQGNFTLVDGYSKKLKFQLINNLIVIPIEINGVKLSFLLDSGVSKPILFNIANSSDSLQINHVEKVFLRGLGSAGAIEAIKSKHNTVRLGAAINLDQELYVVFDEDINFTPRLGIPIHGIIGYDIFRDFIVDINYGAKIIKFHDPSSYTYKKCKKCEVFDLSIIENKAYIDGLVTIDSKEIPVKLLIDSGGSDALWLFENEKKGIEPVDEKYFEDYLGKGLSGSVYGKRSKLTSFSLKHFEFKDVNVAFPDSLSTSSARKFKDRSGSIHGELLKRFNIIFDYRNEKITLKKNRNFKAPFNYNKSGIVLEQNGIRVVKEAEDAVIFNMNDKTIKTDRIITQTTFHVRIKPAIAIVEIRANSPAIKAGLLIGDIVISVNGKDISNLKLQDINDMFTGEDGKKIRLKIERDGRPLTYSFKLEKLF